MNHSTELEWLAKLAWRRGQRSTKIDWSRHVRHAGVVLPKCDQSILEVAAGGDRAGIEKPTVFDKWRGEPALDYRRQGWTSSVSVCARRSGQ